VPELDLNRTLLAVLVLVLGGSEPSWASLTVSTTFNPSGAGSLCGIGFDPVTRDVWVFGCSAADVQRYSASGAFLSAVTRPGESSNDVDVELTPKTLTLGATSVPGSSLLFINGETGPADIYAVNRVANSVIATLPTAFGVSHVVGGAYHPSRKTLFLVQDLVPGAADENRIAEIDPTTGSVLNTFQITATFPVDFGDLDVCEATGNLIVASSDETRLAEYGPTGGFVAYHDLPVGVSSLSGLGIDDTTGDIWVANTAGNVWRLEGGPCGPAPQIPVLPGIAYLALGVLLLGVGLYAGGSARESNPPRT
jgi:hypothetical protein